MQFAIASTAPANGIGVDTAAGDFPQAGFDTNWIVLNARNFFQDSSGRYSEPLTFVFERQPAECSAVFPINPSTLATSGAASCTGTSGGSLTAWYCNDTRLDAACPAVSYHTATGDPDGSNLFFAKSVSGPTGTISLYEIAGAVGSPVYSGTYAQPSLQGQPGPGGNWTWQSGTFPNLPQAGTTMPIAPGPSDDRFTSCVVRNSTMWAAQTIGLPATSADSTAVQWWSIGLDANKGKIYDVERLGGDGAYGGDLFNSIDPSIAVNLAGDVMVGYSGANNQNSTSLGALGAMFAFKSHSGCSEYQIYLYKGGLGPYYPQGDANGNPVRTGDYSQTVVDPLDDNTFFTTTGWAGESGVPGNGYGWLQGWGFVTPTTPSAPSYVQYTQAEEDECPASRPHCKVTLGAPVNSQSGDVIIAEISAGLNTALYSTPPGWTYIPWSNLGNSKVMNVTDPAFCDLGVGNFLLAHTYGGPGETGRYEFEAPRRTATCKKVTVHSELTGVVGSYRGACESWQNTSGSPNYDLLGYPQSTDSPTITAGPVTPGSNPGAPYDNMRLIAWLFGSAEADDSGATCSVMSSPILGSPTLYFLDSFSGDGCSDQVPLIGSDYSPANHAQTYGPYSSTDGVSAPKLGLLLLLPPY